MNFRRQPTLEPDIPQLMWTLDRSESDSSDWILCLQSGGRAETSEEEQRGKLVILAGATSPGRDTFHLSPREQGVIIRQSQNLASSESVKWVSTRPLEKDWRSRFQKKTR